MSNTMFVYSAIDCLDPCDFLKAVAKEFGLDSGLYDLHKRYIERYGIPKCGRNRATYIANNYVIKLPISQNGFVDNEWEGSLIAKKGKSAARTRLIYNRVKGFEIPILLMEKVVELTWKEIESIGNSAIQIAYATDCLQVGLNKSGDVVAYDYGLR